MRGREDLGIAGAGGAALVVAVIVFLILPLLALLVRRRWRLAEARGEEVRRLLRLAAEEDARAEAEAALTYISASGSIGGGFVADSGGGIVEGPGRMQCAVCYSPTTTRCSRCKAVRYCSGRCQILHWRQGHKEECRPPGNEDHFIGIKSVYDLKGTEQSDLCNSDLEIEGKSSAIPVERLSSESNSSSEIFSEDDNPLESSVDIPGTDSTSDSFADSLSSSSSGPVEVSHDEDSRPLNIADVRESFARDSPRTEADASKPNHTKVASMSVNNLSSTSNFSKRESTSQLEEVNSRNSGPVSCVISGTDRNVEPSEDTGETQGAVFESNVIPISELANSRDSGFCGQVDPSQLDARSLSQSLSKMSHDLSSRSIFTKGNTSCKTAPIEVSVQLERGVSTNSGYKKSDSVASRRCDDVLPLKSEGISPLSSISSAEQARDGRHNVSCDTSSSMDSGPPVGSKLCEGTGSVSNGICDLKAAVSSDVLPPKTKGPSSPLSLSFAKQAASRGGGYSVSRDTCSTIDSGPPVRSKLCEGAGSVSNGICDLKSSVRKAVQQFKPSQILRHYPLVFRSDLPGKYKMLFPYDLFIKLYNCDKAELRPCGLTNCGNSCYANAVLQCLAFTRPLSAYLLQGLHSKTCPKREWCFTCEFENLITKAKDGHSPFSPIGILSHIQKIGSNLGYGREEDAHEFLRYAIDAMQSVCLKEAGEDAVGPLAEETTLIQLMFGGYLLSKIKCTRCRVKSERHERIMDLTVEIHGDIGTLEEALSRFTATEILDGENKYQCNRCKSYERAKKKLSISEAPNILTIALKRFQFGKFGKLNKAVRFPEFLNLAPYMTKTDDKSPVYRLYAVVVHLDIMNAAFSGHYVCYVKSTQKKWYKIDDSKVKPVELERVLSKNAYMLLYARCSPRAPGVIRNATPHEHAKSRSRCRESLSSSRGGEVHTPITRLTPTISSSASSVAQDRSRDHSYWADHHASSGAPDLFDERIRFAKADSSSDSSSLLSCSDEGSWSTESTRNSTSTEEFSEYIFGDSGGFSSSSSFVCSEDSGGFTYSPLASRHAPEATSNRHRLDSSSGQEDVNVSMSLSYGGRRPGESNEGYFQGKGVPPFLYSDISNHSRELTEGCRSREAYCFNPHEVQSNVTRRRCIISERTAQTFYK